MLCNWDTFGHFSKFRFDSTRYQGVGIKQDALIA